MNLADWISGIVDISEDDGKVAFCEIYLVRCNIYFYFIMSDISFAGNALLYIGANILYQTIICVNLFKNGKTGIKYKT